MIRTVDADVADARLHPERIEQAMVIVRIAIRLVRGEIEAIRAFDEIETIDREGHRSSPFDLGRMVLFEIRVGSVNADVVRVEQSEAEDEVGDLFLRRHVHAYLD